MTKTNFSGTERYEIVRCIGQGGMGTVYEARDRVRGAWVALKVLHGIDPQSVLMLKQEFRTIARVSDRHLVTLHDLVFDADRWFFTMDLVNGVPFLEWAREGGPTAASMEPLSDDEARAQTLDAGAMLSAESPPPFSYAPLPVSDQPHDRQKLDLNRLRDTLAQLIRGLVALHRHGVLHRDIKPSNVLVTPEGRVVILDFGLATHFRVQRGWQDALDTPTSGTADYMAPEQSDPGTQTEACDFYSVGVMLFQALTGRLPFLGPPLTVLVHKRHFDAPSPQSTDGGMPLDLVHLCERLLSRDPKQRPGGAQILAALLIREGRDVAAHSASLGAGEVWLGRERHLLELNEALTLTDSGRAVARFVHGTSGMGKSALIKRFLDLSSGFVGPAPLIFRGCCYERESVPYKALDQVIDELTEYLTFLPLEEAAELLPADASVISRLFPVFAQVRAVALQVRVAESPDPRELRRRAVAALSALLRNLSAKRRLIISIDDLQWGDADSGQLLADILRNHDAPPVLLLGSYRTEEGESSPFLSTFSLRSAAVGTLPAVREVEVGPLTSVEARDLAVQLVEQSGVELPSLRVQAWAQAIATESGGNPFFVESMVEHQRTSPSLTLEGFGLRQLSLAQMLHDRFVRLSPEAHRLLTVVCVCGQPLPRQVAEQATGLKGELQSPLALLRAQRLLRVRVGATDELIEPYHDRIRETLVDGLDEETRSQENLVLGLALESAGSVDVESLAEHFLTGGDLRRAQLYTTRAAEKASATLAFDLAADHYARALRLHRQQGEDREQGAAEARRLLCRLGDARVHAGRCLLAAASFTEAAVGAPELEALELRRRAGEQLLISGHLEEGKRLLVSVLQTLGMRPPTSPVRALLSLLFWRVRLRLRGLSFVRRAAEDVPTVDLSRIDLTWGVGLGLGLVDHVQAAEFQARSLYYALGSGEPYRIARSVAMEVAYAASAGHQGQARVARLKAFADPLVAASDNAHVKGLAHYCNAVAAYSWGRWKVAAESCTEAATAYRDHTTGLNWEVPSNHIFHPASLSFLGEYGEIAERVPTLLEDALARGNRYAATNFRIGHASIAWLARDEPEVAAEVAAAAMGEWAFAGFNLQHFFDLAGQTDRDLYQGRAESVWRRVCREWPGLASSLWLRVEVVRIQATVMRARAAIAALASGVDVRAARDVAKKCLRQLSGEVAPWARPNATQLRAALSLLDGDLNSALRHLVKAIDEFRSVDMELCARSLEHRRGELLGGDEGAAIVVRAEVEIGRRGCKRPSAIVDMLAPGMGRR